MVTGAFAIVLNALTVISIGALLVILLSPFLRYFLTPLIQQCSPESRIKRLWALVLAPWLIGSIAATLALAPTLLQFEIPLIHEYMHWHHPDEFVFSGWHGLFIGALIVVLLAVCVRMLLLGLRSHRHIQLLLTFSQNSNPNSRELSTPLLAAFTVGFWRPIVFVTTALQQVLSKRELDVINLHEQAHIKKHHLIAKWCFKFLTLVFPPSTAQWLEQHFSVSLEQQADNIVASQIPDRAFIAETLLKVKRLLVLQRKAGINQPALNDVIACHFGIDAIELRIQNLLATKPINSAAFYWLLLAVLPLAVFSAFSADLFHHSIESIFSYF